LCSLTKSAAGHGDLVAGSVATRDAQLLARLDAWRSSAGAIASPFDAWLALRGLRTLPLRIERQSASAAELARRLCAHPRVARVHYPGLEPRTRALAALQMPRGAGPLLAFELRTADRASSAARDEVSAADALIAAARLVRPGTSFGGYASSWERRARWPSERAPAGLIRLSVGLEDVSDLWDDIERALRT
jgi:cystathionine gamma-synthase